MSVGTLYTISPSPRSQTVTGFVKYAGIPIEIHDTLPERVKGELCEEYTANFPLKRCPSFVSKDGSLKLTETIAILVHRK
jgi:glutathione S-transferase